MIIDGGTGILWKFFRGLDEGRKRARRGGGMLDRLSWLSWTLEVRGVGRISIEFHRV